MRSSFLIQGYKSQSFLKDFSETYRTTHDAEFSQLICRGKWRLVSKFKKSLQDILSYF